MPDRRYGYISRTLTRRNFYKLIPGLLCRAGQVVAAAAARLVQVRPAERITVRGGGGVVDYRGGHYWDYLYCGLPYGGPTDRGSEGNEGRRGASHEFIFVNHNVL